MKLLVVLALFGLCAAEPQYLTYSSHWATPYSSVALASHPYVAAPAYTHLLKKRSLLAPYAYASPLAVHAGALSVPADEPIVAHAKAAQLIQQNTEGLRNNLGGIPLALPADTPAVAAGKIAHSIAHANEAARNAYPWAAIHGIHGAPVAHLLKKRSAVLAATPLVHHAAPLVAAPVATAYAAPLAYHQPLVATHSLAHTYHLLKKRSILATPYAVASPLAIHGLHAYDPINANARAAHLIQHHNEAVRNTVGGIPLSLPADRPDIAAEKIAHSIIHAQEAARNTHSLYHLY